MKSIQKQKLADLITSLCRTPTAYQCYVKEILEVTLLEVKFGCDGVNKILSICSQLREIMVSAQPVHFYR